MSFKGKGSTEGAMTSGQGADGGWVIGWGESVEGNIDPEQTDDLCFIREKKMCPDEMKEYDKEMKSIIWLFSFLIL